MRAEVGDGIVIEGQHVGDARRSGEVIEVRGEDGAPPYRIRWADTGRETLLFPGPDCRIVHASDEAGASG